MCLGIPGKIVKITVVKKFGEFEFREAKVNFGGAVKSGISLLACPGAKEGDYCLTHAGSALSVIDEKCARETVELLREYSAL